MEAPTKKQQAILDYMREHVTEHSYWPSIRDIQAKFRFASTNAVFGHLTALERKGVLQRIPGAARAYKIAPEPSVDLSETVIRYEGPGEDAIVNFDSVEIKGVVAAGLPDFTESSGVLSSMQVPIAEGSRRRAPQSFAVRVQGDSMIEAEIYDGDTVIVEPGVPKHGDLVAALIDGGTVIKRFMKQGGKVFLKTENKNYSDLTPVNELVIQGIAKTVMRRL